MEKEIKIQVPDGYEIDTEKSTLECIKFKEKKEVKTWVDYMTLKKCPDVKVDIWETWDLDNKFRRRIEAETKIKLLMPYYGGEITNTEWGNGDITKYDIECCRGKITNYYLTSSHEFLAFHTEEQRDDFLKYNAQLVRNYYMLDN